MDIKEYPRIGNRSDALDLLDSLIKKTSNKKESLDGIRTMYGNYSLTACLKALRDAIEREIL